MYIKEYRHLINGQTETLTCRQIYNNLISLYHSRNALMKIMKSNYPETCQPKAVQQGVTQCPKLQPFYFKLKDHTYPIRWLNL